MPERDRFVADTNVILSRLFFVNSVPAMAMRRATAEFQLIVCSETVRELESVLCRSKFDVYLTLDERLTFFHRLHRSALHIESVPVIAACRDPKDDKFLALAVAGQAKMILSGDRDLLALHPFRGIDILNPRQYIDLNRA
jgi:putative PIN family toxin of toxin-antitoxin system